MTTLLDLLREAGEWKDNFDKAHMFYTLRGNTIQRIQTTLPSDVLDKPVNDFAKLCIITKRFVYVLHNDYMCDYFVTAPRTPEDALEWLRPRIRPRIRLP